MIRLAEPEDAPTLAHAEWATAEVPGRLAGRPGEIPVEAFAAKIVELRTRGRYVVALRDGAIVGHALLDPMPLQATAHVFRLTIVVHPGHLGQGIGAEMLQDLVDWAERDPRVGRLELNVRDGNERAIRLYRRFGFEEEGRLRRRIRFPDGTEVDDLVMGRFV
ncbi:MAG TPA: GNAT family N-acetyltransferase [Candidatus Polarisedimenticolaceae bacterium]